MIQVIKYRYIWLSISSALVLFSIIALILWRLNLGIDFTGGSLFEFQFSTARPQIHEVKSVLEEAGFTTSIQLTDEEGMILRMKEINEEEHQKIIGLIKEKFGEKQKINEIRFDSIGSSLGGELKRKSTIALFIVLLAIIAYITWSFRKVSKPVVSWKYGLIAIIVLFHDVIFTLGVFAVIGKVWHWEINTPFIAALITVLGYSINDTIVIFDRIRENVLHIKEPFQNIVNLSINQTLHRSINTSLTTLLVVTAIFIFGGESLRVFSLALIIGITIGTYSSLFLASSLLTLWQKK